MFRFYNKFKTNFSERNKLWEEQIRFGGWLLLNSSRAYGPGQNRRQNRRAARRGQCGQLSPQIPKV